MNLTRLTAEDGPRLRAIRLRALKDAPDAFGSTWAQAAQWPPESWTRQLQTMATFVVWVDGPEGMQDVGIVRGANDDEGRNVRWLLSMWVAPEVRRSGVASALIEALIDWARGTGADALRLEVGLHNTQAAALYQKHGFVPTGTRYTLPPPRDHITEVQYDLALTSG